MAECFVGGGGKPKIAWNTSGSVQVRAQGTANAGASTYITVDLTKDGIIIASDTNAIIRTVYQLHEGVLTQIYVDTSVTLSGGYYYLVGTTLYWYWGTSTWMQTTTLLQFENK